MLPCILGLSGPALGADERAFFREAAPAGYILFARNCVDKAQLRALTDDLRALSGRADVPILIDQEGGRVARLRAPAWPEFPPQGCFAELYARAPISGLEAARVNALAIALILAEVGINVACLPVLDLRHAGGHDVVGDRALGSNPLQVASLGRMILDGLAEGGVSGVIKHMPGHGRADADSHHALPIVASSAEELEADLIPFSRLARRARIGMTAHVLFPAWDAERCATLSPVIVADIIRGRIGFDGLLLSDDIGMEALSGSVGERAAGPLAAGCDLILHCSGVMEDNVQVVDGLPALGEEARARLAGAMAGTTDVQAGADVRELLAKRDALLLAGCQSGATPA